MLKLKLVCCFALIGKIDTIFQCPVSTKEYTRVLEKLETIDERCGEGGVNLIKTTALARQGVNLPSCLMRN